MRRTRYFICLVLLGMLTACAKPQSIEERRAAEVWAAEVIKHVQQEREQEAARTPAFQSTAVVQLKTEPPRRLLEEDIIALLRRRFTRLTIVRDPQQEAVTVLIRELQFEERQEPERTQTVVVSNWQTDLLVSALTMPRGASMLFEHTQGGAEIQWAFEVVVSHTGQVVQEQLLRDRVRRPYHFCSNMRVQNVFGGVQSAMAYPNNEVRAVCESGQQPVRVSALRSQVTQRLAEEITAILIKQLTPPQPSGP